MDGSPREVPTGFAQEKPRSIQVEQLFGKSCEIKHLSVGDELPIGGSVFSDELTVGVVTDFDHFSQLFERMGDQAEVYNSVELQQWLEASLIDIDPTLFAKLYAFTQVLEQKYPTHPHSGSDRDTTYAKAQDGKVTLSEIFESGNAECAEIAALAQYYLQMQNITSSFFNGELLLDRDHEFAEPHSFILIHNNDKQYIFDPANPTPTTQGNFPSLYTTEVNFDQYVRQGQKKFVTATNVVSKKFAYFGVGNGTNVSSRHIV